jgi:dTDP-4-dehydrorhamnose reductase
MVRYNLAALSALADCGQGRLMRIFITGAKGQLGMVLQGQLAGHDLGIADLPEIDITDYGALAEAVLSFQPDVVIHCAAYTNVDGCARDPELAYRINGLGTQNVALTCRRAEAQLVHLSTNEVFAGERPQGYDEWMLPNPVNAYARSKVAAEHHVRSIVSRHYIVRTAWLYGPRSANFIQAILRAARDNGVLRVVADEIGNPTYVEDLAGAIARLIELQRFGTYHLVNEGSCSRLAFAREALRLSGLEQVPVTPILSREYVRASTPPLYSALNNIAAAAIGIRLRPWQEALAAYLAETWPP